MADIKQDGQQGGRFYGLIGARLGYSLSKRIHESIGRYAYDLYELEAGEVADLVRRADVGGLNVTIPYKRAVIPLCAALSDAAQSIGSVNTLVRRPDGSLFGDNTDCDGFLYMADRAGVDFAGKKVLVLGSGGTSLTVCHAVRARGGEPVVISRSGENSYDNLERHADAPVLVNTTPVGTYPASEGCPVDLERLPNLEAVLDVVYNPLHTRLCLAARDRGLRCSNGLPMLVAQAVRACERFTGAPVPDTEIERILAQLVRERTNIAIVGMPGSGKTTVGHLVADALGWEFLDTDTLIERRTGRTPEAIIRGEGEAAFRTLETEAVREAGQRTGVVIATGGGAVKIPENRDWLRQNGAVAWLRRDVALLPVEGRPLSQGAASLAALFKERRPLYEAFADFAADNNGAPEDTAQAILRGVFGESSAGRNSAE